MPPKSNTYFSVPQKQPAPNDALFESVDRDREGRLSLGKLLVMRKRKRERREQEERRAASHPVESELPPEPVLPPTPVSSAETILDLSDEEEDAVESLSALA
jgi:hypothetical protein